MTSKMNKTRMTPADIPGRCMGAQHAAATGWCIIGFGARYTLFFSNSNTLMFVVGNVIGIIGAAGKGAGATGAGIGIGIAADGETTVFGYPYSTSGTSHSR